MTQQPIQPDGMNYQPQMQQGANAYEKKGGFGNNWSFGFWECCSPSSLCLLACCCPCVLFGRTSAREAGESDPNGVNPMCCAFYCSAIFGLNSVLQTMYRGTMRAKHGIPGTLGKDFLSTLCCPHCALVQEEKESLLRATGIDPTTQQPYQAPAGMTYP